MIYLESSTKNRPVLTISGAEHLLQVLIADKENILFYQEAVAPRQGMRILPLTIDMALKLLNINPKDLRGIACVAGPGYFTALRVVLSVATGMYCAAGVPMGSLNYLYLIAKGSLGFKDISKADSLWVLTYAKKDMVYVQGFKLMGLQSIFGPSCVFVEGVLNIIKGFNPAVVGSGVRIFGDMWNQIFKDLIVLPPSYDTPLREILWSESISLQFDFRPITPLYLRASDAEKNLDKIKDQRGL